MYVRPHIKYPLLLPDYKENHFLDIFLKNIQILNFMKFRPVGAELFHAKGRTDGRTDGETDSSIDTTQLMVAVRSFKNEPKNGLTQTLKIEGRRKSSLVATFPQKISNGRYCLDC